MLDLDLLRQYEFAGSDVVLRRYLTPTKFADFAATAHLHFAPASRMDDQKEGIFTVPDQVVREKQLEQLGLSSKSMKMARKAWDTIARSNASAVVLSCWSMGASESERMWSEYGQSDEAVAIETNVQALRSALGPDFLAVRVQYVDRNATILPNKHSLEPFFFKGLDFEWENELRFVAAMESGKRLGSARRVRIDVEALNPTFVLAPGCCPARMTEVKAMLADFSSKPKVAHSRLSR